MDVSMATQSSLSGSPTQCNEDRSYERFEDPESLPTFDLHSLVEGRTDEDSCFVDGTLDEDDTGAVKFSSHSAGLYSESTAGSDMDQPESVGRSHYFATTQPIISDTADTADTAARAVPPETPHFPRSNNPFASKFQTPLLAGSQLFAQTPFSAGLPQGSPTSSRPSPSGLPRLVGDVDTPQGPVSSSLKPRFPTSNLGEGETPLRLLPFAESSEPGSDDVPTQIATVATVNTTTAMLLPDDTPRPLVVPLSSPLRSKRRSKPGPLAEYESMRESQKKREAAAASSEQHDASSSDDEVADDDTAQKRRRLARYKREEGAKTLSAISMSRSSFRDDTVEVPASARREYKPRPESDMQAPPPLAIPDSDFQDFEDMDFPLSARRRRIVQTPSSSLSLSVPSLPTKPSLPDAIPETSPRRQPTQDDIQRDNSAVVLDSDDRPLAAQRHATRSPEPVAAASAADRDRDRDSPSSPPAMPPALSTRAWTRRIQGGRKNNNPSHGSVSTTSSPSPLPSLRSREATPTTANESDLSAYPDKKEAAPTPTPVHKDPSSPGSRPLRRQRSRALGRRHESPVLSGSTDELARPSPVRPSRASRKSSRTTLRQTSRQPSVAATAAAAAAAAPGIFAGMAFAISFQARRPHESERECAERMRQAEELQRQIQDAGGQILTSGFDELFEADDEGEPRLLSAAAATGFTALLADGHSRKAKYMQALALGLPCLAARWVTTCLARGVVVDWAPYLLCAGQSSFLGDAIRSRTGSSLAEAYDASTATLADVIERRPRLLQDVSILVVTESGTGTGRRSTSASLTYVFLTQVLGARLSWTHSLEDAREQLLVREDAGRPFDWLYEDHNGGKGHQAHDIYESLVTATSTATTTGGKKRKRPSGGRSGVSIRMPQHVYTLSNERVIQSLILGRLIEADEMDV